MRNFLLGVAVGATGMAIYTGHLKVVMNGKEVLPFDKDTQSTPTEEAQP